MKKILLLFIGLLFWAGSSWGQVSTYTFASSMGTYTPITGGTFLISGTSTMDSWASTVQTIPSFNLNGVAYTKAYVTSNGILTLGGTAPSSSATTGISTNVGSGIAICPFSGDLDRATTTASTEIRWETIENEVIFQWQQVKRYGSTNVESFDMQARLNTTNGVIIFIYKINTGPGNSTSYFPQVGIRTSATDYTNRLVASGTEDWATSLSGTANTNTCRFTSVSPAKGFTSGLTFTYTPPVVTTPPNCAAIISPTDGTTNVQASATLNWASGGGTPTGYKLYFGAGSLPGTFTDLGNVTTFDPSPDLSYSTTYYWKVVPYNDNGDAIGCSVWSFTTMADPTILTFPYEQKFESTEFPPNGWEEVRTPSSSYGWISNSSGYTGKCARFDSFNNTTGNISNLITPPIDLTSLTLARLIFKFKNPTGGDFSVLLSTDGGLTYPNVIWTGLTGQTAWLEKTADITAYIGTNIKIAFKGKSNYGSGDAYIYLDDITIEEIPSTPIFSINPTSKDFGTVVASGAPTAAQTFTIKNTGAGALIITSNGISITGADADQFTLSAVSYPINLTTGQSTTVDVAFAPATAGSKTAELNVVHNAAGSPSTAVLTGAALPAGSLVESFEGETFPPTDWKVINSGDANTWYRNELNAHSGVACASIKYSSEAHNDWLITPMLQPLAGNSTLSFWAKNYLDSYIKP